MNIAKLRGKQQQGVGLIEVMVSIVVGMLLVLVIYQIYEVSESRKRTITAGSDAMQNAAYGLFALGREISMAGNTIASSAAVLNQCLILRPIPVTINAGADDNTPDQITVLYGASSTLSTPVPFMQNSTATTYVVRGPVGFSQGDVVAAVQGSQCTVATINAAGVLVNPATGFATLTVTPVAGNLSATYGAVTSTLVNLGPANKMGSVLYSVDPATLALRTTQQLPTVNPPSPMISDVVNLKAQYGLDTDGDGVIDRWQSATGAWAFATVTLPPPPVGGGPLLATLQQVRAIRLAIVTRSAQFEKDVVATDYPPGIAADPSGKVTLGMLCDSPSSCVASMKVDGDDKRYRYKVLETVVPMRNVLWAVQ